MTVTIYIGGDYRQGFDAACAAALAAGEPIRAARGGSQSHRVVNRPAQVMGLDRDTKVELVGTFWQRDDAADWRNALIRFRDFYDRWVKG